MKVSPLARKTICVFCSSSDSIHKDYYKTASELGREIARRGYTLVYGGSNLGLMGELARSACRQGGSVIGIIPRKLQEIVPSLKEQHELLVTEDLRHRKTLMELRSGAFVALPGGFGTLEELMEILALKQLGYHDKPVVILNALGFYDPLIALFEKIFKGRFAKPKYRELYHACKDVPSVFEYLRSGTPSVKKANFLH